MSFFAYANFVLIGYLKDISADREAGYRIFPVVFGWDTTVLAGDVLVLISTILVFQLVFFDTIGLLIAVVGTVIAVSGQLTAHFTKNKTEANAVYPILSTVRSFILWQFAVAVAFHPPLSLFAVIYYVFFEMVLRRRPEQGQI